MSTRPLRTRLARLLAWLGLGAAACAATMALRTLHVPAAALLGPMLAGLGAALCGTTLQLPRVALLVVQAVFGCLLAASVDAALVAALHQDGLLLVACGIASIALSAGVGLGMARAGWLPGSTAIWGCAPGAAATMVLLSEAHGGDPRIVALMQSLRIVVVTLAVVALAALVGEPRGAVPAMAAASAAGRVTTWQGLAVAALLVVAGALAALRWRAASAALLLPALAGGLLQAGNLAHISVPLELAMLGFGVAGCAVGLRFDRAVLLQCWRLLPAIALAIVALVGGCGLLSWLLLLRMAPGTGVLTAWLALTPGGLDTAVAIAASVQVSLPVVIAAQLLRLGIVTAAVPVIARRLSREWGHGS